MDGIHGTGEQSLGIDGVALESAEGTSLGTGAKRIRLDRRVQKTPSVDQCKDLQAYRQLGHIVLHLL